MPIISQLMSILPLPFSSSDKIDFYFQIAKFCWKSLYENHYHVFCFVACLPQMPQMIPPPMPIMPQQSICPPGGIGGFGGLSSYGGIYILHNILQMIT
jgi:hypothetical protein